MLKMLDSWIRNFLWSGDIDARKMVTVSWKVVCNPVEYGGLGIRSLKSINTAAMLKLSWDILSSDKQWVCFLKARFLRSISMITYYVQSSIWPGVKSSFPIVLKNSIWIIGNGTNVNFWLDRWISDPIAKKLSLPTSLHPHLTSSVSEFIADGKWTFPLYPPLFRKLYR